MKIISRFEDHEFPYTEVTHTRQIVRAIIYDDEYKIVLNYLHCTDIFGERDLYETPGGGVEKGETLLEALHREILEETGAEIDHIVELGRVIDYYNLIKRKNDNHFYLAHIKSKSERHLTDYEKEIGLKLEYMDIDEAIRKYQNTRDLPVNNIVRARELPILLLAKEKMGKN